MKSITPKEAILIQCHYCMNTAAVRGCDSKICELNYRSTAIPNLKRIKAHCKACIGSTNSHAVRKCDGKLMSGDICSLHPFRLGHNPNRKGIGNLTHGPFSQPKTIDKAAAR